MNPMPIFRGPTCFFEVRLHLLGRQRAALHAVTARIADQFGRYFECVLQHSNVVPATLLILLFSLSLIGPAVVARTDSQLPECCRRDGNPAARWGRPPGNHRASSSAPFQRSVRFSRRYQLLPHGKTSLARNHGINSASLVSQLVRQVRTESFYRVSFCRSKQERGPPTLSS